MLQSTAESQKSVEKWSHRNTTNRRGFQFGEIRDEQILDSIHGAFERYSTDQEDEQKYVGEH